MINAMTHARTRAARLLAAALVALVVAGGAAAETDIDLRLGEARAELEKAINAWNEEAIMRARAGFERLLDRGGRDWLVRYYIALADYRVAIWHLSAQNKDAVRPFLDEAEKLLEESLDAEPDFAESHALLGAVLGLKIGLKPISGMWIGPRIGGILAEAMELDPENPRLWMIEGVGAFHRPKMFGGGYENAREAMLKSIDYFETYTPADPAFPDWGHSEAYAWLGKMEMHNGELESAAARLKRSLELNPQNGWVIYVLSPDLAELRHRASTQ